MESTCSSSSSTPGILAQSLNLLLVVFLLFLVKPSVCSPINPGCTADGNQAESLLFAVQVQNTTYFNIYGILSPRLTVTVYFKNCSMVETVGPDWYRLETIGSTNHLGSFDVPSRFSGASLVDQGIEFYASEEPLMLLDLPRTYKWTPQNALPSALSFRLTIEYEGICRQVESDYISLEDIIDAGSAYKKPSLEPVTAITPPPTDPGSENKCHMKFDCTGKKIKPVCGSGGNWYSHTCALRLQKCLYKIYGIHIQRDLSGKSCGNSIFFLPPPTPKTTTPPPKPPTTELGPINPAQPCFVYLEDIKPFIHLFPHPPPKCDRNGLYRPIQCLRTDGVTECYCSDVFTGAALLGTEWQVTCESEITEPPPNYCSI